MWRRKITPRSEKSKFYNMASDPTSPRLRGCTVVKTELPPMMHSTSDSVYAFCFKGAFLTQHHQYVFYYGAKAEELLLARLCLYSHTWQVLPSFRLDIVQHTNQVVLPLPWTGDNNHHQVILGFENNCKLLTLSQPANSGGNAATDPLETTSVCFHFLQPPENGIVNFDWLQAVAYRESRASFVLCETTFTNEDPTEKSLDIYKLNFDDDFLSLRMLELVHPPKQPLKRGHFMAVHEGHLYIGVVKKEPKIIIVRGQRRKKELQFLNEVQHINLSTLALDRLAVTSRPHYTILRRQTALQFCLVGDTVYILNALLGPLLDGVCVVKNQLWALKLTPSMSMTQINDEPQGQHECSFAVEEHLQPLLFTLWMMTVPGLHVTPDGLQLWVVEMKPECINSNHWEPIMLRMFCIPLCGPVPSLAAMTLHYMLIRRPLTSLQLEKEEEEEEPRNGNRTGGHTDRIRFVRKQERTLPYLRAFAERTPDLKGIAVYHLPDGEHWEDGPLQQQVDEEMLNNGEDGEEAAAFQEE